MIRQELLDYVPAPLRADLIRGRWLPIVGAGMSKNATVPHGLGPLDWRELGKKLGEDLPRASFDGPLDTISAYQAEFGRTALVDRVTHLLRINDAQPGPVHRAFAQLGFERVITTNFDLLLERAYEQAGRGCLPLVEEVQLSGHNPYAGPALLKLHGDVHHPQRMVLTEDDYDDFLRKEPLISTYLAATLIDRTAILVGYSLDDPDMRQLLALVSARLGRMARPLWTIQVDAPGHVVDRYQRRNVRVINLQKKRGARIGHVLEEFFKALRAYWQEELIEGSQSTDEQTLADLRLPSESSATCYFAVPLELVSWYRETLGPIVEQAGIVPVFARDVLTPEGTIATKVTALIERAKLVVVDGSSTSASFELGLATSTKDPREILVVVSEATQGRPFLDLRYKQVIRPADLTDSSERFIGHFANWLASRIESVQRDDNEAERLLSLGEWRAAVIAVVSSLERALSGFEPVQSSATRRRPTSLTSLVMSAADVGQIDPSVVGRTREALTLRNEVLHLGRAVTSREARVAVDAVAEYILQLKGG